MQFYRQVLALVATLVQASGASIVTWSSCSVVSFPAALIGDTDVAECTMYAAPLCRPGICETPASADSTIDVFVKHVPAKAIDPEKAANVWLLQGGPLYIPVDTVMVKLYANLKGNVNVYTMDHRGTGQSTHLECERAQAAGSNSSIYVEPPHVPACAQELQENYGDLSAFSTTSAATDLVTFISDYGNDFSTIVYSVDYGSMWVERVMQLDPPEVTGYVLDGITATSDTECGSRFKKKSLEATIQHLFTTFDKDPKSTCASLIKTTNIGQDNYPPSIILRSVLGWLLADLSLRTIIPPVVHRLSRCAENDVDVLTNLVKKVNASMDPTNEGIRRVSYLLENLIIFSEMWETPAPSVAGLKAQFEKVPMSSAVAHSQTPQYCAFSKEKSATCDKLKVGDYDGNGIIYERDEFWNKAITIPDQASVLLMKSKMNPLTPNTNAKSLLSALGGDNKELTNFEHTVGGNLMDPTMQELCGMAVLTSYVQNDGKLDKLDKSCVADELKSAFNWTTPTSFQYFYLSTDDAYDGDYDASLSAEVTLSSTSTESSNDGASVNLSDLKKKLLGSGSGELPDQLATGNEGLPGSGSMESASTESSGNEISLADMLGSGSIMSLEEMMGFTVFPPKMNLSKAVSTAGICTV